MVTESQVRDWALAFPETDEHAHFGRPSFRTRKRIFVTLPHGEKAVLKLPMGEQEAVVQMAPAIFSLNNWSHQGWTEVALTAIDAEQFRDLLEIAWRGIATKRAQKEWEGTK